MTTLEELTQLSERLAWLLDDPHEGLATWNIEVARVLQRIATFAPKE